MIKKTITYTDYNGDSRTEDFYFNLTKMELAEMQVAVDGGLETFLKKIVAAKDYKSILASFKEIIAKGYGEKSPDGRFFKKSEEISRNFIQSPAFEALCDDFFFGDDGNAGAQRCADFINGMVPKTLDHQKKPENSSSDGKSLKSV